MPPGKTPISSAEKPHKMRIPVDIALDAGLRPMLIRHGFTRKTKRYFVRERPGAIHYVAITPPDRRSGYLTCLHRASAGIISKKIVKIVEELDLRKLFIHKKYTDRDCHFECDLEDIYRFKARIDFEENIRNQPFFLRPFVKFPRVEIYIPEMREFVALWRKIDAFPSSPLASSMADAYAHQEAQLHEKYILPWFDQCEDMNYFAQWVEYWVGRRAKTPNLLLATAYCLASNFEDARTHLKNAVALTDISFDKTYRQELRYENKMKFRKTIEGRKKKAKKISESIMAMRKRTAEDARALARYFDIDLC